MFASSFNNLTHSRLHSSHFALPLILVTHFAQCYLWDLTASIFFSFREDELSPLHIGIHLIFHDQTGKVQVILSHMANVFDPFDDTSCPKYIHWALDSSSVGQLRSPPRYIFTRCAEILALLSDTLILVFQIVRPFVLFGEYIGHT